MNGFERWRQRARKPARCVSECLPLPIGRLTITEEANQLLADAGTSAEELLARHQGGDWGDVAPDEWQENDERACSPSYSRTAVVSVYALPDIGRQQVIVCTDVRWEGTVVCLINQY